MGLDVARPDCDLRLPVLLDTGRQRGARKEEDRRVPQGAVERAGRSEDSGARQSDAKESPDFVGSHHH